MHGFPSHRIVFSLALALLLNAGYASASKSAQPASEKTTSDRFVGTWEGQCQDGRTFVVVTIHKSENRFDGTVSIANMHGDDEGACMLVLAPPSPEHAQQINDAVAQQDILSFDGSKRPNGNAAHFELRQTDSNHAQLKFFNTPVEDHPWQLQRVKQDK